MPSNQPMGEYAELDPWSNQASSLRPKTVATAEVPQPAPFLTQEDLDFMQQVELEVFAPEKVEPTLSADDLEFMRNAELSVFGGSPDETAAGAEALRESSENTRRRRAGRSIGRLALSGAILVGSLSVGLFGITAAQTLAGKDQPAAQSVERTKPYDKKDSHTQTTQHVDQTTRQTIETTTTTAPKKPFETQPGQVIGSFEIPKTCIDIQLVEVDTSEIELIGQTQKLGLPNGQVKADYLTPDPTPTKDCAPVDAYARNHPGFVPRSASTGHSSAVGPGNPQGKTSHWQPIAVHENHEGQPGSAYPGQVGLSVMWGHRVTRSAPNMDVQVLEPGDVAYSHRADGKKTEYVFKELLLLEPDNIKGQLQDYYNHAVLESVSHGATKDVQMVALGGCADDTGNGGGDSKRVVSIFIVP